MAIKEWRRKGQDEPREKITNVGEDVVVGVLGREVDFGYPIHRFVGKGRCAGVANDEMSSGVHRCVAACGGEMSRRRRSQIDGVEEDDAERALSRRISTPEKAMQNSAANAEAASGICTA
ncbi:hypothetical protein U1Q18_025929 [Sarracenia purpurea var. burkii]